MFFLVVVIEECLDGLHDDASMLQAGGDQGLARLAAGDGFGSVKSPTAWQVHSQELTRLATGEWKKGAEGRVIDLGNVPRMAWVMGDFSLKVKAQKKKTLYIYIIYIYIYRM